LIDALSDYGITQIDMPLTPERVWRAIQDAKAEGGVNGMSICVMPVVGQGVNHGR